MSPAWSRLVRFIANDDREYCGQPEDPEIDVGLAVSDKQPVSVKVLDAKSALEEDSKFTGEIKTIKKLLSPISPLEAGTLRCIGLNYTDHAAEMGLALPEIPELFMKAATCIHSPTEPLVLPSAVTEADAEVELAVVIGKDCKNVSVADALDYVLGYTTANDVTARNIQKKQSQWGYCKGFDGFCPLGPALVSAKALPDPSKLSLKTVLNGKTMQESTSANLIFSIQEIIAHLSVGTTLPKGTIILTGTPSGIGHSHNPPIYLTEGAKLRVWISGGLGTLTNLIVAEK